MVGAGPDVIGIDDPLRHLRHGGRRRHHVEHRPHHRAVSPQRRVLPPFGKGVAKRGQEGRRHRTYHVLGDPAFGRGGVGELARQQDREAPPGLGGAHRQHRYQQGLDEQLEPTIPIALHLSQGHTGEPLLHDLGHPRLEHGAVEVQLIGKTGKVRRMFAVERQDDDGRCVYRVSGAIFFASVDRFTRGFASEQGRPVTIDVSAAHFRDLSAVEALDKVIVRLRREGDRP